MDNLAFVIPLTETGAIREASQGTIKYALNGGNFEKERKITSDFLGIGRHIGIGQIIEQWCFDVAYESKLLKCV